nr:unnamed protein product [Digitaria exilis]
MAAGGGGDLRALVASSASAQWESFSSASLRNWDLGGGDTVGADRGRRWTRGPPGLLLDGEEQPRRGDDVAQPPTSGSRRANSWAKRARSVSKR